MSRPPRSYLDSPEAAWKPARFSPVYFAIPHNTWRTCHRWKFAYPDPLANFHKPVAQGGSRIDIIGVMRRPSNVSGHPGANWIYLEQPEKCKIPTWNSCHVPNTWSTTWI
ncbi:hypothetical protein KR074_002442 [Drosophila pseudoananassae]|nr:hypothetical protein KR074_002442 [Drosophila pseudoananassae]